MSWIVRWIPLPGLLAVVYLVVAMLDEPALAQTLFSFALPSGRVWVFGIRDLFIVGGLVLLFVEIYKSTHVNRSEIFEHSLAMVAFVACFLLFLLVPKAGTSLFGIITLMALIDVIAGFTVTIAASRRTMAVERN